MTKQKKTLDSSHKKLLTSQDALNKAIAKYGADSRQAEIAQLGLDAHQKGYANAAEALRIKQITLYENLADFATCILPEVISVGSGVAQMYGTIKDAVDS